MTRNNTLEFSAVNFGRQIEIPDLFSKHAWTLDFYCACLQHNLTFSHLFVEVVDLSPCTFRLF